MRRINQGQVLLAPPSGALVEVMQNAKDWKNSDPTFLAIANMVGVDVTVDNPANVVYVVGSEFVDGSIRFVNDPGVAILVQQRVTSIWQPYSLESAPGTFWLGHNVGLAAVGHHFATEGRDGHLHFYPRNEYDSVTGLTSPDAKILEAYFSENATVFQPDFSGLFTGTLLEFSLPSVGHLIASKFIFKVGPTAPTAPIRIRLWKDALDSGEEVFDRTYSHTLFTANTEVELSLHGTMEYVPNTTYHARHSSDEPFSWLTDAANQLPWLAADYSLVRENTVLQSIDYVDGNTFTVGQYTIVNGQIYVCNTAGVQTGTFASNAALWDAIDSASKWFIENNILKNVSSTTGLIFTNGVTTRLSIADARSELFSPDGTSSVEVSDSTVSFVREGNTIFITNATHTKTYSPNLIHSIELSNTETKITCPQYRIYDESFDRFVVSPTEIVMNDALGVERLQITATDVYLRDTLGRSKVHVHADGTFETHYNDGSSAIYQNETDSHIYAVNGTSGIHIANDVVTLTGDANVVGYFEVYDGIRDRLVLDTAGVKLTSPDGINSVDVRNANVKIIGDLDVFKIVAPAGTMELTDGTNIRFSVAVASTVIYDEIGFTGGYLELYGNRMFYTDGTEIRIDVGATHTTLLSPDATKTLKVNNTKVEIEGNLQIDGGLIVDTTTLVVDAVNNRVGINAATPTHTSTIYGVTGEAAIQMMKSSGAASVGAYSEFNNSDGAVRFMFGVDGTGFSGTGNRGHIATWSNHPLIFSTNQIEHMRIEANGDFLYNDGTNDRIVIQSDRSQVYDELGLGYIALTNKEFAFHDSVYERLNVALEHLQYTDSSNKLRIDIDSTATRLYDQSGVNGGNISILSGSITMNDGIIERFNISPTNGTKIWCDKVTTPSSIHLNDWTFTFHDGTRDRIAADSTTSKLVSPDGGAELRVDNIGITMDSVTAGFVIPRMTTVQRDALTIENGMMIYNITTNEFNFRENAAWITKN